MLIIIEVDLFLLYCAPEALDKDGVQRPTRAIHTDLHARAKHQVPLVRPGDVAPELAVLDLRRRLRQRPLRGAKHERQLQRVVALPADHIPRAPVKHSHQGPPAPLQRDGGDIDAPDMVMPQIWLG